MVLAHRPSDRQREESICQHDTAAGAADTSAIQSGAGLSDRGCSAVGNRSWRKKLPRTFRPGAARRTNQQSRSSICTRPVASVSRMSAATERGPRRRTASCACVGAMPVRSCNMMRPKRHRHKAGAVPRTHLRYRHGRMPAVPASLRPVPRGRLPRFRRAGAGAPPIRHGPCHRAGPESDGQCEKRGRNKAAGDRRCRKFLPAGMVRSTPLISLVRRSRATPLTRRPMACRVTALSSMRGKGRKAEAPVGRHRETRGSCAAVQRQKNA